MKTLPPSGKYLQGIELFHIAYECLCNVYSTEPCKTFVKQLMKTKTTHHMRKRNAKPKKRKEQKIKRIITYFHQLNGWLRILAFANFQKLRLVYESQIQT